MPKGIKKSDWNLVHDLACEVMLQLPPIRIQSLDLGHHLII